MSSRSRRPMPTPRSRSSTSHDLATHPALPYYCLLSHERRPPMTIPRNTVQPLQDCPIRQWSSGHEKGRPLGTGRFAPFVGFHAEKGKLDAFDAACAAAHIAQMEIKHTRDGGVIVPHWS